MDETAWMMTEPKGVGLERGLKRVNEQNTENTRETQRDRERERERDARAEKGDECVCGRVVGAGCRK